MTTTARCATHQDVESTGVCPRCGRFVCASCADGGPAGWCVTCEGRPEARLHISRGAWGALWLAIGGLVLPPLALGAWWLALRTARRAAPAEAPVLLAARWLVASALVLWAVVLVLTFG